MRSKAAFLRLGIGAGSILGLALAPVGAPGVLAVGGPAVVSSVALPPASFPAGVAVDSQTGRVYVAVPPSVLVFESDLTPAGSIPTDPANQVALDSRSASRRLFVGTFGSGTVQVFSLPSNVLLCTVGVGPGVSGLAFNPVTEKLYVSVEGPHTAVVLDGLNNCHVKTTIALGDKPAGVAVDQAANRVYVAIHHEQKVSVIDGGSDTFLADIPVLAGDPTDVAANPITHRVYVAYSQGNRVTEINTGLAGLGPYSQTHLTVGDGPRFVAVDPDSNRAYVSIQNVGTLALITAGVVGMPVPLGGTPQKAAVDTGSHCVFVAVRSPNELVKVCDPDNFDGGEGP